MIYLTVLLQNPTQVGIRYTDCEGTLQDAGRTFVEIPTSEKEGLFLGFYDWLRTSDGQPIGIRITFHDDRDDVRAAIRHTRVGHWSSDFIYEVQFESKGVVDECNSVDQEFGVSRAFMDDNGVMLLLFDASEIEEARLSGHFIPNRNIG